MLIRNARLWPSRPPSRSPSAEAELDVRIAGGRVVECEPGLRTAAGEEEIDAAGCALLPGLHDHHLHLRALAAAQSSVRVGPQGVRSAAELTARLREADAAAAPGGWLRCVGYHESVAGPLDRWALDRLGADPARPVRVQHRSGALWVLNSAGVAALGLDDDGGGLGGDPAGVERDGDGRATGRLWRMDRWLGDRVPARPDERAVGLASVSARAAALGVTGFTDATPGATERDLAGLAAAVADGTIAQRLHCMAPVSVAGPAGGRFSVGPVKIMLDDETLPSLDALADGVRRAHAARRPVAVHCVTRVQLVLTLAALDLAGRRPGDRIEHGAVIPAELVPALRGLTVVSQPHFVAERGEQYASDVEAADLPDLWRLRSLSDAGVAVAAGSDAPFGGADPWAVMRAAARRPALLGPGEAIAPAAAIGLFLGSAAAPDVPRVIAPGARADLVLLRCPPRDAVRSLGSDLVAATIIDGSLVYRREGGLGVPRLPEQALLGDGGQARSGRAVDDAGVEASARRGGVRDQALPGPFVHPGRAVEPDRVVEARPTVALAPLQGDQAGRNVGGVGEDGRVQQRVVRQTGRAPDPELARHPEPALGGLGRPELERVVIVAGPERQRLRGRGVGDRIRVQVEAVSRGGERRRHVEDDLAVLDRHHPAGGVRLPVPVPLHLEQGRPERAPRAQEVAVQRVRQAPVGHGLAGDVQGLRGDLAAVEPHPRPLDDHARPVQVLLDELKVKQVEDGRPVSH
jgi:predicted amidohydrolase YtcJ